jgi:outer membrane protein assembly factor BamA
VLFLRKPQLKIDPPLSKYKRAFNNLSIIKAFVHQRKIFFLLLAIFFAAACNPARKLGTNEYLLNKNKIIVDNSSIDKEDLKSLYKQKPNRKILGLFRFHLWLYNLVDKDKTEHKKAEWVKKTEQKNIVRRAKGKKEISTDKLIFREKLLNIGEEPAILDSSLTERTKKQFQLYLLRKGFFHADVTDTIILKKNHQANVIYNLHCDQPYTYRSFSYSSKDSVIHSILVDEMNSSILKRGDRYDEDIIEKERERITLDIRNRGYYFFNKNYISFEADSSLNSHEADIYMYADRVNENVDQTLKLNLSPEDHHIYHLNNIFIQTDYNPKEPNAIPWDTSFTKDTYFLSNGEKELFRKEALLRVVYLKHDSLFRQNDLDYTYNRLLDLGVFKFIKIIFTEVPRSDMQKNYLLDVNIQLTPLPKQDYTIEFEATHSGGNLGGAGGFGYRNKNRFKGAELLELKLKGSVEALRNFNDSVVVKKLFFFNTFEVGPELNLNLKRLLFVGEKLNAKHFNPKTALSLSFNYQNRPDYTRTISNLSFGWLSRRSATFSGSLFPMDINSVKVNLSDAFNLKLRETNDPNLQNSYKTHLTPGARLTEVYTNQALNPYRSFIYCKLNIEWSGWTIAPLINSISKPPLSSDGKKTVFGISYAQFLKPDFDVSYHQRLNAHNTLVYRIAAGIGIEGSNSNVLPFEKSFFSGGANSIRAWQARTLGPGSYKDTLNIEQSGDIKMEGNIELRSSLIRILEGALFADVGNIWTHHVDVDRPGSHFEWKNAMNELAIGAGAGLRFNFSFFVLRLDAAVKIHDPSLDLDDRWVYSKQKFQPKDITLNLAIGYPF